jgi:hypothetical protein
MMIWRVLLPFGLLVAAMIVIQAVLASKLHRPAPPGMSRFRCFRMLGGRVLSYPYRAPLACGETKEFRERLITYRAIILGMGFLLMPLMAGLLLILTHRLNP